MRRWFVFIPFLLLIATAGCGSGNNTPTNVGLFGNWNIAMYPTNNNQTPSYVFAVAMSQEGTSYSGASITYTGSVAPPGNMCINANTMHATATTSGSNYTITFTDTSNNTIIQVTGTLPVDTTTVSGNYTNPASETCPASEGTMNMVPQ